MRPRFYHGPFHTLADIKRAVYMRGRKTQRVDVSEMFYDVYILTFKDGIQFCINRETLINL